MKLGLCRPAVLKVLHPIKRAVWPAFLFIVLSLVFWEIAELLGGEGRRIGPLIGGLVSLLLLTVHRVRPAADSPDSLLPGQFAILLEGVLRLDRHGMILAANRAAAELLGFEPAALIGQRFLAEHWQPIREDGTALTLAMGVFDPADCAVAQSLNMVVGVFNPQLRSRVWLRVAQVVSEAGNSDGAPHCYVLLEDLSEKRSAEAALRASEERFSEFLDYLPAVASLRDLQGRFLFVNQRFEAMAGCSREQIIGRTAAAVLLDRQADHAAACEALVLQDGQPKQFEEVLTGFDGHRLFLSEIFPLRDSQGCIHALGKISTDITERRRAELALSVEALRRRVLVEQSRDGIVIFDSDWQVVETNPSFAALIGYAVEEVVGKPLWVLDDRWSGPRLRETFAAGAETSGLIEAKQRRRDGQECHVEIAWARASWMGGEFLLWVVRDVTERARAARELHRNQEELARAQAMAHLGTYAVDFATGRVTWSERLRAMLGDSGGEPSYGLWLSMVHPDDRARVLAEKVQSPAKQAHFDIEYRIQLADGRIRWHHDRVALDYADSGAPLREFGTVQDVTDRKMAEAENTRLQQHLQQAQKMEAIGLLTGGFAHDFNNILASMLGYTDLAVQRCVSEKTGKLADYLREVQTAGARARDLVAKMLLFSRSRPVETAEPLAAQDALRDVESLLQAAVPSSIELVTDIDEATPPFLMDSGELHQILTNLVLNARDAVGGRGRIEIILRPAELQNAACSGCIKWLSGRFVEVAVRDDGCGIPPDVLPRMFDPFFSTKPPGKGSGLGLAVVHGIVHRHGGHILVDSKPDGGTLMRLLFPACGDAASALAPGAEPDRTILAGSGNILLVDDEPALVRLYSDVLAGLGYCVAGFTNSREALDRFSANPEAFDVVITDQTMPRLTGLELARAVLAIRPDLPLILLTGFSEQTDADSTEAAGIQRFFTKPVALHELAAALAELLKRAAPNDEAGSQLPNPP